MVPGVFERISLAILFHRLALAVSLRAYRVIKGIAETREENR